MKRAVISLFFCLCIFSGLQADEENPTVLISTNLGDITLELFPEDAPITVENFLYYVNTGFYDDLLFHRVIDDFVIQAGAFYEEDDIIFWREPGDPIINESYNGLSNLYGTIAMARTTDPNSATSQFYINDANNTFLDRENASDGFGYCVFGHVIDGMDVAEIISQANTISLDPPFEDLPYPLIYIIEAQLIGPPEYWLSSDLNDDGIINFEDFSVLAGDWSEPAGEYPGDLDGSLTVDVNDLDIFSNFWLWTAPWY